ncbi:MAG: TMEM165/GDT1 family protein [Alphaproteobacteria bacterium]|nr:TMEM165/GDT1 family protein [Alphaproteobacteria bacterium]
MEAFFVSTAVVAIAEIGDKTQLLALLLAARYRRPVPIVLGILCATLANHALAAWVGAEVAAGIGDDAMRWVLGVAFIVMAGWCLIPDKADGGPQTAHRAGAFVAALVAFFIVEIGDKTQIATVALAARFQSLVAVTAGTTLGMLLANAPVVFFGDAIAQRLPLKAVRLVAALLFVALGIAAILMPSSR